MAKNCTPLKSVLCSMMSAIAATFISLPSYALDPVTVKGLGIHRGGNIQYSYRVTNNTRARTIISVSVGNRGVQPPNPISTANMQPELYIYPVGSYWGTPNLAGDQRNESPRLGGLFFSPPGWTGKVQLYAETDLFSVDWTRSVRTDPGIPVGQTFDYAVTVPLNDDARSPFSMSDPAYLNGHFTAAFAYSKMTDEGPAFWNYTGPIVAVDTTPPTLSIVLTPAQQVENDKLVPITAAITVKDDYDPQPEIKLESITANDVLEAGNIQGAQYGQDVRQFLLKADIEQKSIPSRIYTVTYSATDGSGNKSTATGTFTVLREAH